jgi:hypothetical protein
MKKQERDFEIDYSFDWGYGVKIEQIRKDLDALEKLGAQRIDIEIKEEYGSVYVGIKAMVRRLETNEEYAARVQKETKWKEENERREQEVYEKLKAKFG